MSKSKSKLSDEDSFLSLDLSNDRQQRRPFKLWQNFLYRFCNVIDFSPGRILCRLRYNRSGRMETWKPEKR